MTDQNDFIKLLFDTLKETTDDNTDTLDSLVKQQILLVSTVENMPITDLKKALDDHNKESSEDIGTCEETVKTKSDTILEKVNDLAGKVKLMIGIVIAAVALTGIAYFIARFYIDYTPKKQITEIEERIHKQQQNEHDDLIEAVREEIRKFHPEADKQEKVR